MHLLFLTGGSIIQCTINKEIAPCRNKTNVYFLLEGKTLNQLLQVELHYFYADLYNIDIFSLVSSEAMICLAIRVVLFFLVSSEAMICLTILVVGHPWPAAMQ